MSANERSTASPTWHRVWLLTAIVLAFGPWLYFYAKTRASLGRGATFELLAVCWPLEVAAAFVAGKCVRRLKRARERGELAGAVARRYLVGARLAFWLALAVALLIPFALFLSFGISLGVAG
jgi:hypothetical protein